MRAGEPATNWTLRAPAGTYWGVAGWGLVTRELCRRSGHCYLQKGPGLGEATSCMHASHQAGKIAGKGRYELQPHLGPCPDLPSVKTWLLVISAHPQFTQNASCGPIRKPAGKRILEKWVSLAKLTHHKAITIPENR